MIWQSVMVILLGCALIGNTPIAAVSFSRPVARNGLDGEELLQALEFLDRYEGARRAADSHGNMITDDYPLLEEDYELVPYDQLLTQDRFAGNGLPPLPPYNQDYPMVEQQVDPYDFVYNTGLDYPMVDDRSLTIGDRMKQDWQIRQVVNRLFEDAVMEEMLREDAAAAADLLDLVDDMEEDRDDAEEEDGFVYDSEQPEINNSEFDAGSDADMPSFVLDDDYSNQEPAILDSFADYSESVDQDDGVDEGLLEAVILKLTEAQMKQKLLEEEGVEDEDDLSLKTTSDVSQSTSQETDAEIDNFVAQVMSELLDGSENLADRLVTEIEQEGDMLQEEDEVLEPGQGEDALGGVVFGDGWEEPTQDIELYSETAAEEESSCPALDIILDDCMVVDEFPGLGDGGYKFGFGESCNRHQLCYFCSGSFEIPTSLCDETYKMELMSICNGDEECGFRAKYFWLSALASRDPTPVDLDVCRQPCVVAYLLDN